ncbi:MAG: hypothetical protein QOH05_2838, partial [Acetobacteraceae bacterium]|nr:hypothetical protein [Acetobacteraceae bacterium]
SRDTATSPEVLGAFALAIIGGFGPSEDWNTDGFDRLTEN